MQLPSWAVAKVGPLPVWGWGALSLGGGVGYVLYQRRRAAAAGAGAPTLAGNAQAVPSTYPLADTAGGGGGAPGGFGSGEDYSSQNPIGQLLGALFAPSDQAAQNAITQPQQMTATPATALASPSVQSTPSLLGGGYIASQTQLQNPVGSADAAAAQTYFGERTYAPSLTDYSTEQPGGISVIQAGLPGTQPAQGLTYTMYGTQTGTGPVVPASERKPGERYDASGRVIL